jgi:hypothetical protein
MRRALFLFFGAALCAACVKPVELSSTIQPTVSAPAGKSSEKAAVLCSEGLLDHVERASPGTLSGIGTAYELELGEPLCGLLLRSVESSYRAAHRASMMPLRGQYGGVVRFDLTKSALSIERQPNGSMRVAYTISVAVERLGRELQPLGRNVVTGNRLVDCATVTDREVQEAVEDALQQVADGATRLLVARVSGPRVRDSR